MEERLLDARWSLERLKILLGWGANVSYVVWSERYWHIRSCKRGRSPEDSYAFLMKKRAHARTVQYFAGRVVLCKYLIPAYSSFKKRGPSLSLLAIPFHE